MEKLLRQGCENQGNSQGTEYRTCYVNIKETVTLSLCSNSYAKIVESIRIHVLVTADKSKETDRIEICRNCNKNLKN